VRYAKQDGLLYHFTGFTQVTLTTTTQYLNIVEPGPGLLAIQFH